MYVHGIALSKGNTCTVQKIKDHRLPELTLNLKKLLQNAEIETVEMGGGGDPEISDIFYDSRKVTKGSLYIAIPGTKNDGDSFIADAVRNGAAAIVSEKAHPESALPWVRVKNARKACGVF
jgi:UDP-N-acetylmuramoyl-L-alanyl-D-glutamate--2,6-diaminopimelate ligase